MGRPGFSHDGREASGPRCLDASENFRHRGCRTLRYRVFGFRLMERAGRSLFGDEEGEEGDAVGEEDSGLKEHDSGEIEAVGLLLVVDANHNRARRANRFPKLGKGSERARARRSPQGEGGPQPPPDEPRKGTPAAPPTFYNREAWGRTGSTEPVRPPIASRGWSVGLVKSRPNSSCE